jgi:hypothetical protein
MSNKRAEMVRHIRALEAILKKAEVTGECRTRFENELFRAQAALAVFDKGYCHNSSKSR